MSTLSLRIQSLADIESIESIPFEDREVSISPYQLIANSAARFADKIALRYLSGQKQTPELSYSYHGLLNTINQTANALIDLGVNSENSAAIVLPNLPHSHFALWGAIAAGRANPINPMLEAGHIADIMNEAEAKVLVTLAPHDDYDLWQKAQQIAAQVPTLTAILTVDLYKLHGQIAPAKNRLPERLSGSVQLYDFDQRIALYPHQLQERNQELQADDIAAFFHTGGTTGKPKLARHSHHNQVACAWQIATTLDISPSDVVLCGLPLFHVNAVFVSGIVPFLRGGEVVIASPQGFRNPAVLQDFWALVENYKISVFSSVPTVIAALMDIPIDGRDVTSLRVALSGAAPLPVEIKHRFENITGLSIVEGYGQTEGTCGTSMNPLYGVHKAGSVGLRAPYVQLRVVSLDADGKILRDCQTNEIGTVAIKGPNVFQGYHNDNGRDNNNAKVWLGDGWLNSGDLGRLDEDGYLWLTGRSKELIIRGGHNIDPTMIEEALCKHPSVQMVAAVGKPDSRVGELPIAYVELRQGASATEVELLTLAQEHIPERAAVPKSIHIINAMPLTAVGKVFKPELRRDAIRRVCLEELDALNKPARHYSVSVDNHPQFGDAAAISLLGDDQSSADIDDIIAVLSRYAFHLKVSASPLNDCDLEANPFS